jgi:hypothetical protein
MKQHKKLRLIGICIILTHSITAQILDYNFTLNNGTPKLEIRKEEKPVQIQPTRKTENKIPQTPILSEKEILKKAPMMAPMVELSDMVKDFSSMLNQKKKRKMKLKRKLKIEKPKRQIKPKHKHKQKLKQKKPHLKHKENPIKSEEEYSWDLKPRKTKKKHLARKAFDMGSLGGGLAVAGVAAGGVAMAGMAMGAADNEKLEKELQTKENLFGILVIRTKVDEELNNDLFTSWMKFKNLREKGKDLIKNGENQLRVIEDSMDNMLGDLQAMDNHLQRHLGY